MKPWLILPPKLAHDLAPVGLQILAAFRETPTYTWRPLVWKGLSFANPLGIAGGVDKDAALIEAWWKFGPGFIEVGTVTPLPQSANPGKIIDRDPSTRAVWNRMGFPGGGMNVVRANLSDLPEVRRTPVFVNIGKNRTTPNETAAHDYAQCIENLSGFADAFVINISSPNTAGLRELLEPKNLERFLSSVLKSRDRSSHPATPVLLKLSPDMSDDDLRALVETSVLLGIDGFIATNTTLGREPGSKFPPEGGVSGRPLTNRSLEILHRLIEHLGAARPEKLVVSVGGIMTPHDVHERLKAGADLVQVYSTLIFEGPTFFRSVAKFFAAE